MTSTTVLVSGANGFVGRALVGRLLRAGVQVRAAVRRDFTRAPSGASVFGGLNLGDESNWSAALDGVDAVIHCAARAHVIQEAAADPLAEFRRVNVDGTLALASRAAARGVRRFVFVSSIGVNGSETFTRAFRADDAPAPHSPYAQSKMEAERALLELAVRTGLEVVIVRPPLVYGADAPGNFGALLRAVHRGIPLPLGAVQNKRSLVALDNLADLLAHCAQHPSAPGQVFLVSDDEDVSTPDLLRRMAAALACNAKLLPIPVGLLRGTARLLGKASAAQSLCSSLQVDIAKTRELLGWAPIIGLDEALARAARQFLAQPT